MSTDLKAFGTLKFESADDLKEADAGLAAADDELVTEVRQLVSRSVARQGRTLRLALSGNLSADANMIFQTWLEDLAESAASGHLDIWQESFGDDSFVRIHAGGQEESVEGPFPSMR